MLWVTFGYAGATEMAVAVGANAKVENYFAEASLPHQPHIAGGGVRPENWRTLVGYFTAGFPR